MDLVILSSMQIWHFFQVKLFNYNLLIAEH